MFSFLKRKKAKGPVVYARSEHCISRKNIDGAALKTLYGLFNAGYTAYLVGGGVRDLLMGRTPKDFDVGTSARPNEVKKVFRNCYLIGRRFRLAQVRFGGTIIETATFRREPGTLGDAIEAAAGRKDAAADAGETEIQLDDNAFGTPETDAYRRDFTVNGLFYNIEDFSVIDWVGGMKDLKAKIIRTIGDPERRFREDPVRMMRAVKFSSRLGFKIEKKTFAAMKSLHSHILSASTPRVCEEVWRLFSFGSAEAAFRLMWRCGMLGDLLPELSAAIDATGGEKSPEWKYLAVLDALDAVRTGEGTEVSNSIRAAVLMTILCRGGAAVSKALSAREAMQAMMRSLKIPKAVYFPAVSMLESVRRLSQPPAKDKRRYVRNAMFLDALDYNRIVLRAEGRDESVLEPWIRLYEETSGQDLEDDQTTERNRQ